MMTVYKHYDQESLDKQYDARATVPDFSKILKSWQQRSETFRQQARMEQDLCYGSGERRSIDVIPAADSGSPLLVFFHGGYWQGLGKEIFHFVAESFVEQGIATALVNYPLAPAAAMDEIVASCRESLVYLYRHAVDCNCSQSRIFVCGHSAGGHIAAMLLATEWNRIAVDLPPDLIKGGCALSGLFDLEPIRLSYLNKTLGMDEAMARRSSPLHLTPGCKNPFIVSVGAMESDEFHAQSESLEEDWLSKEVPVKMLVVDGANHFTMLDHLSDKKSQLHQEIVNMVRRNGEALS